MRGYSDQDIKILRHIGGFGTCKTFNQVCPICLRENPYTTCHETLDLIDDEMP